MSDGQTPSQTVGPYFAYGLTPGQYGYPLSDIADGAPADESTDGELVWLEGCVYDGEGNTIADAMLETWQADAQGRYRHPADPRGANAAFTGFARFGTGTEDGDLFRIRTVKPGAVGEGQAPHINLIVFMRGLLSHLYTRIYFADEAEANAADPVLSKVPEARRRTLVAERRETAIGTVYRFDIHMQGEKETVFFDL